MSETKIKRFAYLVMMVLFAGFAVTTSRYPAWQNFCVGFVVISAVCCWFQVGWFAFGAMVGVIFWLVFPSNLHLPGVRPGESHYYRLGFCAVLGGFQGWVVDFISRRFS